MGLLLQFTVKIRNGSTRNAFCNDDTASATVQEINAQYMLLSAIILAIHELWHSGNSTAKDIEFIIAVSSKGSRKKEVTESRSWPSSLILLPAVSSCRTRFVIHGWQSVKWNLTVSTELHKLSAKGPTKHIVFLIILSTPFWLILSSWAYE